MIKIYYVLTKPGIIFGNLITTAAGFALAAKGQLDLLLFLYTLIGITFIMASGCVFNNYIDRDADAKMARTQKRALVKNLIAPWKALTFGSILGVLGTATLFFYTNPLTALTGFIGFVFYVLMYSFWKYRSVYGTLLGSLAGAVPPLVGYVAVSNQIDSGAILLFLTLVFWQMPHFYAIALYRLEDYRAALIPVLPLVRGSFVTKIHMIAYIVTFMSTSALLSIWNYTGSFYLIITLILGLIWLALTIQGFKAKNETLWARENFRYSLIVIMILCVAMGFDTVG